MVQKTIKDKITFQGIGLHSGENCTIQIVPQDEDYGIKFKRVDVSPEKIIPADVKYVSSTIRGTNLTSGQVTIMTVEHVLAALAGVGVTNAMIEVDGPEIPILDGSALPFINEIQKVGTAEQQKEELHIELDGVVRYVDEKSGAEIIAIPSDHLSIDALIDYQSPLIKKQHATLESITDFASEVAAARTFVLAEELSHLAEQGLIKGGAVDNAVVLVGDDFSEERLVSVLEKLGKKDISKTISDIKVGQTLKYDNEMARHKILDLIGDLSLAGAPLKAKIIAKKPGHTVNVEFAKLLRDVLQKQKKLKGKPKYDPNQTPVYQAEEIKGFLPHRYPFLLVDKVIELSDTHVVGVKNVSINEQLFTGHFPDNPVFPGVLQMEALAQTGGLLALNTVEEPSKWDTYFLKMNNVKFKKMVLPGDTMILKMELLSPIRRGIVHMQGTVYVGDHIVSEGELTAQIVKRPD